MVLKDGFDLDGCDVADLKNLMWYLGIITRSARYVLASNYFDQYHVLSYSKGLSEYGLEQFKRLSQIHQEVVLLKRASHCLMNEVGVALVERGEYEVFSFNYIRGKKAVYAAEVGDDANTHTIYVSDEFKLQHPVSATRKVAESSEYVNFLTRGFDPNFEQVRLLVVSRYNSLILTN